MIRVLAAALLFLAAGSAARAEDGDLLTGTLKTIRDRGSVLIGYRESSPPFSFLNRAGQPVGFSLDICGEIAADIAARLNSELLDAGARAAPSGIRMVLVPVGADARIPKLLSGDIDLECGSTTANAERARSVAFSPVFFLAGTRLLVPAASSVASYRDLAGHRIVVGAGTTNAAVIRRLAATVSPPIAVAEAPGLDDAYAQLASGAADAFASDDVLLSGLAATHSDGAPVRLVGEFLSYEPYAIAFRRDDPAFAALVQESFQRMAAQGFLTAHYNRWLVERLPTGETLNLPMSAQLTEMYRALGQPD